MDVPAPEGSLRRVAAGQRVAGAAPVRDHGRRAVGGRQRPPTRPANTVHREGAQSLRLEDRRLFQRPVLDIPGVGDTHAHRVGWMPFSPAGPAAGRVTV